MAQLYRIGIDVTSALTQGGGIGRFTRDLVSTLVHEGPQHSYQLFSAKPPAALPVADPLPVGDHIRHRPAPLDERWLYRLWYRLRLPLPVQLVTGRLDLFHSPDFVLPPVAGSIPTIVTVHDLSFVHYAETFPSALVSYLNRVVPWSVGRATHVLADSQSTRNDLIDVWQVPAEKITVLYGGVDPRFERVEAAEELAAARQRYGLGSAPYILSVGTLQPRKNYQMLIRAFGRIAGGVSHNLAIAGGKGWLYDEMMAEVAAQGLEGRVKFLGFVDDADLPALYSGAELFVFPSLYEGFGLPLLEAMACGTPVVSSNASSLPEVVADADETAAILLSPKDQDAWSDALERVLSDASERQRLVEAGQRQVLKFSWQRSAVQLLGLYGDLIRAARR